MNDKEKQKAVMRELWAAMCQGALKSAIIDAEILATEAENKAFMAWRVECSRLKTLEDSNE